MEDYDGNDATITKAALLLPEEESKQELRKDIAPATGIIGSSDLWMRLFFGIAVAIMIKKYIKRGTN